MEEIYGSSAAKCSTMLFCNCLLFRARQVGYGSSICWKQLPASAKSDDVEKINQSSTVVGGKIN